MARWLGWISLSIALAISGCAGSSQPPRTASPVTRLQCPENAASDSNSAGAIVACEPDAHGLRIVYRTTRGDGAGAQASARVVLPGAPLIGSPMIAIAHGTVGLAD